MPPCCHAFRLLIATAEYFQVELHGCHSANRVQDLINYQGTTSSRAAFVIAGTAVPCIFLPILLDIAHLAEPSAGVSANLVFFARQFVTWWVFGFITTWQGRHFVLSIQMPTWQIFAVATLAATAAIGIAYGYAATIGFPVPCTLLIVAMPALSALCIVVAVIWLPQLLAQPEMWKQVISLLKVQTCQFCFVAIYPAYLYIFSSVPSSSQLLFMSLLPVIKVLLRNWISRALEHLRDEMSEHVLLNADVFSALFVAYCMQSAPSLWAVAGLMGIDGCQMIMAMKKISRFVAAIEHLHLQLDRNPVEIATRDSQTVRRLMIPQNPSNKGILEIASLLLTRRQPACTYVTAERSRSITRGVHNLLTSQGRRVSATTVGPFRSAFEQVRDHSSNIRLASIFPSQVTSSHRKKSSNERDLVHIIGQVLFYTEFLLLLNFVEVLIPIVYGKICICIFFSQHAY